MKISFLTTHLGTFGSVRELIENANRLTDYGHEVNIYNKTHIHCSWLPCQANVIKSIDIKPCDVLILMDSPFNDLFEAWMGAESKLKTFIMMGFDPNGFILDNVGDKVSTERNLEYILKNYTVCADSQWQLDYFDEKGLKTGVPIGGINLDMFKDLGLKRKIDVMYSGDARPRKGTSVLVKAIEGMDIKTATYFGTIDQDKLVTKLNTADIFIDNHYRAGWCNPVLESMACGCVPICNNIGASRDFAINEQTALVLDDNTPENFRKSIDRLRKEPEFKQFLRDNAKEHIKQFSYDIVTKTFEQWMKEQIS